MMENNAINTNSKEQKTFETRMLIILILVLAIVWLVSKFIIGINFSLMEQGGYVAFGYHEIRAPQVWSLEFDSFSGSISADANFPAGSSRLLQIHSGTDSSALTLEVKCGKEKTEYTLTGEPLSLTVTGDSDKFKLTLSGTEVTAGYFNAVWE